MITVLAVLLLFMLFLLRLTVLTALLLLVLLTTILLVVLIGHLKSPFLRTLRLYHKAALRAVKTAYYLSGTVAASVCFAADGSIPRDL